MCRTLHGKHDEEVMPICAASDIHVAVDQLFGPGVGRKDCVNE
jgi:hypothetical protein